MFCSHTFARLETGINQWMLTLVLVIGGCLASGCHFIWVLSIHLRFRRLTELKILVVFKFLNTLEVYVTVLQVLSHVKSVGNP